MILICAASLKKIHNINMYFMENIKVFLVKSIVELHGGSISVENEYGKGSEFIVTLPARAVQNQNTLPSRNMKNRNERIQVEFSDVYV